LVEPPAEETPQAFPMLAFLGYWCVAALIAFTLAGEKMPWLTVHVTLPLILVGGWAIGRVSEGLGAIGRVNGSRIAGILVLPAVAAAFFAAVASWSGPSRPFSGNTLDELGVTSGFVFSALLALAGVFLLAWLWRGVRYGLIARCTYLGAALLLAVITFRTAWRASFVNGDYATEFLVYAHSAPGVKIVLGQIEDLSLQTQGDLGIVVAYDDRTSWIMNWYMRDFPNKVDFETQLSLNLVDDPVVIVAQPYWEQADRVLSNTHYSYTYMRLWWPMMDYYNLTWDRIFNAVESPEYRTAIWDIWWNRDYTAYGKLSGQDFSTGNWPVGERMRLYVRKDIVDQIWQYNAAAVVPQPEVNPYEASVRNLSAAHFWGEAGSEAGNLLRPRGIAAAPDGTVYVADTGNNRIEHFDAAGNLIGQWGSSSGNLAGKPEAPNGTFNEPWGIAVGPDGTVYVADTWNHRIQKFAADGTFITKWGTGGTANETFGFYGPRAIAVDSQNRVFVADTGNSRVMVYGPTGNFLMQIGNGGTDDGQFSEPVGVAVGKDGRLYVADSWNLRVQVFTEDAGTFVYQSQWPILDWESQSIDAKPYLAVAPDGNVWVTDPGNSRVLVFDPDGNFLFTFGQLGSDSSSFSMPTGIAIGKDGTIFISDADNNRIMEFAKP
jgi:DNA-binding beta-propeller fold protein YncE